MGIKDNFQQALRELTGTDKADPGRSKQQIDAMKSAVEAGDTGEFDAVRPAKEDRSFDEIERRAAAAADEYTRQQSAYTAQPGAAAQDSTTYQGTAPDNDIPPMPEGVTPVQPAQQATQDGYRSSENPGYSANGTSYGGGYEPNLGGYNPNNGGYNPNMGGYDPNAGAQRDPGFRRPGESGYNGNPAIDPATQQQQIFSAARYVHPQSEDDEITVISRNTVIDGNVRSFANMSVDGNVKGNIETTKDIDLNGKIVGNIACNNAQMRTSQIQGNVQMKGNAYMERDTLLIGDLTSTYANINGKIKGSLDITGKAELKSDAVVFGDISASTITVNDGAIIQGYVSTTFLNKEESKNIFPEHINIGD